MATGSTVKIRVVAASLCALLVSPPLCAQASSPEPSVACPRHLYSDFRAGHPGWLRCSSIKYSRYSQSSRLAIRAPRSEIRCTTDADRPLGAQTRPVSPSVLATIVERSRNIEVLVLWRGNPGWFLAGGRRSAKYAGGQTGFSAALEYGGIDLGLLYDPARHAATVQGKAVEFPAGTNVILVDNVDSGDGPRFVESLAIDGRLDASANPTMASILARSPGIVAFLRCEIGTPDETTTRMLSGLACDDLKRH